MIHIAIHAIFISTTHTSLSYGKEPQKGTWMEWCAVKYSHNIEAPKTSY